jgi:hypothetical protein
MASDDAVTAAAVTALHGALRSPLDVLECIEGTTVTKATYIVHQ